MSGASAASSCETTPCARLLAELEAESAALFGSRDRVEAACAALRAERERLAAPDLVPDLQRIARAASLRVSGVNEPIARLLCEIAADAADPWLLLEGLLDSHDAGIVGSALAALTGIAARRPSIVDDRLLGGIAARADGEAGPFGERPVLEAVAGLLHALPSAGAPLHALCADAASARVRRLASRILDLDGSLPGAALIRRILGDEPARWVAPYLAWTRATHADLLALATGDPDRAIAALREAETICGAKLLRAIVGEIGWPRLNLGLTVRRFAGVSVGGSFPLLVDAGEAALVDSFAGARRAFERFLVTARGGLAPEPASAGESAIARFREYNLAHADLLARFLDVAPLTVERVRSTIERMDRIVADFQALFAAYTDECPELASVYEALRASIERALAAESGVAGRPLSSELTRLVDMFEDPASLGAVRTLHGLKRYLHQRGLKLGMRLGEGGGTANCTVTLALATAERVVRTERIVEYAEFEPDPERGGALPYPVSILVEAFGRQLVHAQQPLPKAKIFCYGNEVHYFIAYRNHPAFVRIDYSPPGRGGMIDLAYFGVSKYELGSHPNPSLSALERFFRRMDFDVRIENTRVQARYDKERAFDLQDLWAKAEALFRLAPYLMEIDWVIGDLALGTSAREQVATAWAEFFAVWGTLPVAQFLTRDRRGILAAIEPEAAGERELRWNPAEPYRDRICRSVPRELAEHVREGLAAAGLEPLARFETSVPLAQLAFEDLVLVPLRFALARGEIMRRDHGFVPRPADAFARVHPAECLARVLQSGRDAVARSAAVAALATLLARGLRFRTVGAINGFDVQSASLPLAGRSIGLHVLRDASGIFRLALWSASDVLFERRDDGAPRENWSVDAEALAKLVRRANYAGAGEPPRADHAAAAAVEEIVRAGNPNASAPPLPGERTLPGVAASPGRAVGLARLGLANRHPADVAGAVLICPTMAPQDGVFLAASAGVVSTGGGALSHAGLLALQYAKPALVVQGTWERDGAALSALSYRAVRYAETSREVGGWIVTERGDLRERDERLRDGDLVVVDTDEGVLRILGQDAAALAFHASLRQLELATRQLARVASDPEVLVARGRALRARHQLERVIARIEEPVLARHAVAELLLADGDERDLLPPAEKRFLLERLAANAAVGAAARDAIRSVVASIARRGAAAAERARRLIPDSRASWEILSLRLDAGRLTRILHAARELIGTTDAGSGFAGWDDAHEDLARDRLEALRAHLIRREIHQPRAVAPLCHALEEIHRLDCVLGTNEQESGEVERLHALLTAHDRTLLELLGRRRILDGTAGGIELRPLMGGKAANLAEVARLGEGALVPPWFVVTDSAFREAFEAPTGAAEGPRRARPVRAAVEEALARSDLTNAQKAALICGAWDGAQLAEDLVDEVARAYRRLVVGDAPEAPFVAVRSSATEEDLQVAARAGEFDTFLFVRGEESLVAYLKRAWAGLWTERALHSRALLGLVGEVGGGILVQRMVDSRASGVLHTVNVAERKFREMIVNAGLGLGEGIVSGAVAADTIVVSTEGDLERELRFRYLTADKRQRVVLNSRVGSGTALVETLHHQRLRPALEYVEICELVRAAARLEAAYGYPLDIEFAVEGTALFLLQVRPIPTPFAIWRDTVERWPLATRARTPEVT